MSDTEVLKRMVARSRSDAERGVPFLVGYKHFVELIDEMIEHIDRKIAHLEKLKAKKK